MALTKIPGSLLDTASGINGLIYPTSDGTSGQFLKTDGSGNLSFATVTGYTDSDVETYLDGGTSTPTFASATVSGALTVTGDLNITGDINSYNVTDLDVTDQTITLGAGQIEANSGGSGIIVDGSGASILWDETNDVFDFNKGFTTTGNVGIGTTSPSAYNSSYKAIDINNSASVMGYNGNNGAWLLENLYYGSDNNWKHKNTDFSAAVEMYDGVFNFYNTASGTAGTTATLNNRLTIDTSGNVGIGTTSVDQHLHVEGSGLQAIKVETTDDNYAIMQYKTSTSSLWQSFASPSNDYRIGISGVGDALTIDSSFNVGIGTNSPARGPLHLATSGTNYCQVHMTNGTSGSTSSDGLTLFTNGTDAGLMQRENSYLLFGTNDTERMRISDVGNVGIVAGSKFGFGGVTTTTSHYIKYDSGIDGLELNGWAGLKFTTGTNGANQNMRLTSSGSLDFDKTLSASDHDFIVMGYNGSWSQYTGYLASVAVNDGVGVVGRYGITYRTGSGDTGGAFVISDLFYGNYGASGEVFEVNQSRIKIPQIINFDNRVDTSFIKGDASSGNLQYFSDQAQIFHTYVGGWQQRMIINDNGSIGAPSGTNIYNPSDIRLKENITPLTEGLNIIKNLNPIKFNWKEGFDESEADKTLLGFVAQEVQEVLPEAVEGFGTGNVEINDTIIENPLRVNEKFIIPVLVKAIQELEARITELENA